MASQTSDAALKEQLKSRFVGKTLDQVPTPSVILDLAKLETNCNGMLEATEKLGLLWRAHIKTHKTTELTRLQVGNDKATPVNIVVSTIIEAENIVPLLKEYQLNGRQVNVLFSFPLFPSALPRLADISAQLGPGSISLMIDHPSQLVSASAIAQSPGAHPPLLFIKIDGGYHRAGVVPSPNFTSNSPEATQQSTHPSEILIDAILSAEKQNSCILHGVYIHAGHSYGTRTDWAALGYLTEEFQICLDFAEAIRKRSPGHELVLSVGATPTATTIQHPSLDASGDVSEDGSVKKLKEFITTWTAGEKGYNLEVHAGVYATLDLQQLSTHARDSSLLKADDIAISVLAEVASLYPSRGQNSTTEALINAGCLALGREPVADKGNILGVDYSGWGFVMPWGAGKLSSNPAPGPDFPRVHPGWQVGRISQEHGILVWHGPAQDEIPLEYGQRVRVWPNHSCIAGAGFDWYLIVDSRNKGREDEVVNVWPRWRGW